MISQFNVKLTIGLKRFNLTRVNNLRTIKSLNQLLGTFKGISKKELKELRGQFELILKLGCKFVFLT